MKLLCFTGVCLALATATSTFVEPHTLPAWAERLAWTLVHSIWQLTAVAVLALGIGAALRRRSANVRYSVAVAAMGTMFALPCITWTMIWVPQPAVSHQNTPVSVPATEALPTGEPSVSETNLNPLTSAGANSTIMESPPAVRMATEPHVVDAIPVKRQVPLERAASTRNLERMLEQTRQAIDPWLGWIISAWFAGVALLVIRPVWGLWTQARLRRVGLTSVSNELRHQMLNLAQRMGLTTAVSIAESALVRVPMVVGYLRPMILLPASVLSGLTPTQLESLLAHELAHIRRHDWIVNALQLVIETLLFYHPAIWWISNRIRNERELCCDDLALAVVGDKAVYGRMLLVLEELLHHTPAPALAATGGNLAQRVRRLLPEARPVRRRANGWLAGFIVLALMGAVGGLSILSAQQSPVAKPSTEPASSDDQEQQPPKDAGSSESSPATEPSTPMNALLILSSHDDDLRDPLIDVSRMTVDSSHWWGEDHSTRLHQDRWMRSRGFGDLVRTVDGTWIAFRGARLVALDGKSLDDAEKIPLAELKAQLDARGVAHVKDADDESKVLAIQTAEGHVAVMTLLKPFPWSLKLDIRRLTSDKDVRIEQADDGLKAAAWGPVVDGLQAGIAYRTPASNANGQAAIGESVHVKLFVRNTSAAVKDFAWQLDGDPSSIGYHDAPKFPPRLPLIRRWQPTLVDGSGKRAVTSHAMSLYHEHAVQTATLKPGQAVLVAAAGITLWPAVDVDFGISRDSLTAVEVAPGDYQLSSDLDTRMIENPVLRTGTLALHVVAPAGPQFDVLRELDGIPYRDKWGRRRSDDKGWTNFKPDESRRALRDGPFEFLELPCLVYDAESEQPVEGAMAEFEIKAFYDDSTYSDPLFQCRFKSDAQGRFVLRIPRKLLSGYHDSKKRAPEFRMEIAHPDYCHEFEQEDLAHLRTIGLVAKDGAVLKQGAIPEIEDKGGLGKIQRIALKRARILTGRLLGPDGQGLPNVNTHGFEKVAFGFPSALSLGNPRTDGHGRFRFNVRPIKENIYLEFQNIGFPDTKVTVTPEQSDLGDVRTVNGIRIRGRVLDANGKPVQYVSMTAPPVPRPNGTSVTVQRTDKEGRFETDYLSPGEYQLEVGDVETPEQAEERRESSFLKPSGPPPDFYLPYRFKVELGKPLPEVTLRPAKNATVTSTLVSSVPEVPEAELPHAIDVLQLRPGIADAIKAKLKDEQPDADKKAAEATTLDVDADTGILSITGDLKDELLQETAFLYMAMQIPYLSVSGKLGDQPWSGASPWSIFSDDNGDKDKDKDANKTSFKVPRGLRDVSLESHGFVQHIQVGTGPKLFGKSFQVPDIDADTLDVKIYRYPPTTLRIQFVDSFDQPVELKDDTLPNGMSAGAKYAREAEVRRAGAVFESSEALMGRHVWKDMVLFFVLPGEEIDVAVSNNDASTDRRLVLKEGETRIVRVKLGQKLGWTESTKPTAKLDLKP